MFQKLIVLDPECKFAYCSTANFRVSFPSVLVIFTGLNVVCRLLVASLLNELM